MTTVITTAGRPDGKSVLLAEYAQRALGFRIVPRNKKSILRVQQEYNAHVLVAGKNRFEFFKIGMEKPFFFHPNSAAYRLKRLLKGGIDPLIEACDLQQGDEFLDCTLGLASDSIIASYKTGNSGRCIGIEADPTVAFITKYGLQHYLTESDALLHSMSSIEVVQNDAIDYLKLQRANSMDVVYIDPMFHAPIEESSNFTPLRQAGVHSNLTEEWVSEAYRVCRKRVVIKAHYDSIVFQDFGFIREERPNTKFHFGYLIK